MSEIIPAYGDRQCYKCKIILDPELAAFCRLMVLYTKLEEEAAHYTNLNEAALWENKQNRIALQVLRGLCKPGADRI